MTDFCSSLRRMTRLSVIVPLAAIVLNASAASAQPALGKADNFAVLAGTAVTCTDSIVTGDVGVWPGTAVTQTNCVVEGRIHAGDGVAKQAYKDFLSAYDNLGATACDFTLTGTLDGEFLVPGVYCVDGTAKTGTLTLVGDANDVWIFLVKDGAGTGYLEGNSFNVVMDGGGEPCNVFWWVETYAALTDSNFLGTILAGTYITVTGGTFHGDALATTAVTLTNVTVTDCEATGPGHDHGKCNQGVGNGPEACDPGNSNQGDPSRSNDELGGTPGDPGRKGGIGGT